MELQVLNNVAGRIEWDADAAKSAITAVIAPYRDLVVTDDNVKDMEKAQKELASMRRKIEQYIHTEQFRKHFSLRRNKHGYHKGFYPFRRVRI